MTEFLIERHGQSLGNYHLIFLGWTDLDLTEKGYRQAEEAALAYRDEPIDAIFSSPLQRAYHTALPHLKYHDCPLTVCDAFRELQSGKWEGVERSRIRALYPGQLEAYFAEGFGAVFAPDGESPYDGALRFEAGLREIARAYPDGRVLVVCHAAVTRAFCCRIQTDDVTKWGRLLPFASNAGVVRVTFDGTSFSLLSYPTDFAAAPKVDGD